MGLYSFLEATCNINETNCYQQTNANGGLFKLMDCHPTHGLTCSKPQVCLKPPIWWQFSCTQFYPLKGGSKWFIKKPDAERRFISCSVCAALCDSACATCDGGFSITGSVSAPQLVLHQFWVLWMFPTISRIQKCPLIWFIQIHQWSIKVQFQSWKFWITREVVGISPW